MKCYAPYRVLRAVAALLVFTLIVSSQTGGLKLTIVEGEGAVNNIQQRVAREPIVQVTDEQDRPVEGAVVVFLLPKNGASGTFANGQQLLTATTGQDGRAIARGFQPNKVSGEFEVNVNVSYQGLKVSRRFKMSNVSTAAAAGGISGGKIALILAVVGGAVAGVAVAAGGGNKSSAPPTAGPSPSTPPPIVISVGSGEVGPPR
ncbi:MAG: hypothetical protein ACKV22_41245 [Bryobacteraceae bacterium]